MPCTTDGGRGAILGVIGDTPLVPLSFPEDGLTILAKAEFLNPSGSIKDRMAKGILLDARDRGLLDDGSIVVECTSGNSGIALAMVGAVLGVRVRILMSDTASSERRHLIRQFGAELVLFAADRGYATGIEMAERMAAKDPRVFLPRQFSNPLNAEDHRLHTAREIVAQVRGPVDAFVSGYGTGGTLHGVARGLREVFPNVRVVAMEPAEAAMLQGEAPCCHAIEGVAGGYLPPLLDGVGIDAAEKVTSVEALAMTRRLAREHGLPVGTSSGANVVAALRVARRLPAGATVVTILCDRAERYFSTGLLATAAGADPAAAPALASCAAAITRRQAIGGAIVGVALAAGTSWAQAPTPPVARCPVLIDGPDVQFMGQGVAPRIAPQRTVRLVAIADTHLFRDDARGDAWRRYSGRMAKAYTHTQHWRTGAATTPEACFVEALAEAKAWQADLLLLVGDIVSFPSEAAVDWLLARLGETGIPYLYTAGNHDWHYEGLPGTSAELRAEWCGRRLKPLYQGADPLMSARDVGGMQIIAIDNSTYEITPAQHDFFRRQLATGRPSLLTCHIPLYVPGRPIGFGCGHPDWGAAADRSHALERRPQWPVAGHTDTTFAFHRDALAAANLWGVCAGHVHRPSVEVVEGLTQVVASPNLAGGFLKLSIHMA